MGLPNFLLDARLTSVARYVRYFSEVISRGIFPKPKVLQIHKIMLVSVPRLCKGKTGCNPVVRIYSQTVLPKTTVFSSSPKGQPAKCVLPAAAGDFHSRRSSS